MIITTPRAIGIPTILGVVNSDTQDVKNVKVVLEKFTIAHKTIDLTKEANQKLPSVIVDL